MYVGIVAYFTAGKFILKEYFMVRTVAYFTAGSFKSRAEFNTYGPLTT
jgi:hypothetical protein